MSRPVREALITRGAPLFVTFFCFSVGTGAMQLARPLFAASLGASIFFVTLVSATMAVARLVASPATGFLTDRWGRRPLVIAGALLRAGSAFLEFFATSYEQFLLLEFIGSIGISVWNTGASIIIADISGDQNRGQAVALRNISLRLGTISGPFFGALLAAAFDLRAIFILNGASKLAVVVLLLFLIRETRPEPAPAPGGRTIKPARLDFSVFLDRTFLTVILASTAVSMMAGGGVFGSLFPLHAREQVGMSTTEVGHLLTLAGIVALAISFPNGLLTDRFGRKASLVPGLLLLAAAAALLAAGADRGFVLASVLLYGMGEGVGMGASQVMAMDLAPEDRRGAFLGMFALFNSAGGLVAPLAVGGIAEGFGFTAAFQAVGGFLVLSAVALVFFARETGGRSRRPPAGEGGGAPAPSGGQERERI